MKPKSTLDTVGDTRLENDTTSIGHDVHVVGFTHCVVILNEVKDLSQAG